MPLLISARFLLGLLLLLLGMRLVSASLRGLLSAGPGSALRRGSDRWVPGLLYGTVITSIVQSSSAVTVLAMGLMDAGALGLKGGLALIIGANVGTTMTTQLFSFDISHLYPFLLAAGLVGALAPMRSVRRLGIALFGLGLILLGLELLTLAFRPLLTHGYITAILAEYGTEPWSMLLLGAGVTALIQSSSAAVGIAMQLLREGAIPLDGAIHFAFGSNVGTCVTAFMASLGGTPSALRGAVGHLLFNVAGLLVNLTARPLFMRVVLLTSTDPERRLANAHTLFNLFGVFAVSVYAEEFAALVARLVPSDNGGK